MRPVYVRPPRRLSLACSVFSLALLAACSDSEAKPKPDSGAEDPDFDAGTGDDDDDGIPANEDNCRNDPNPEQEDADKDGVGDVCDNCVSVANDDQADDDDDGIGDACKEEAIDGDKDGTPDVYDNCPKDANKDQADRDKDGFGDACDICPTIANVGQEDENKDGVGDACADFQNSDGDKFPDYIDNCPKVTNDDQADADGDGVGDVCDNCKDISNPGQQDFDKNNVGDHCEASLPDAAICAEGQVPASQNKPNLYFLIDRSTSMGLSSGFPTRLDFVKFALTDLAGAFGTPGPVVSNFNIGVGAFPAADGSCDLAAQPQQVLSLAERSPEAAYTAFTDAFQSIEVNGHTPTDRALAQVRAMGLYDYPGDTIANRPKAVVLITDGLPNDCADVNTQSRVDETVAEAQALSDIGVPVFALGFPGVGVDAMQRIANAGDPAPGDNEWFPVIDTATITAALEKIISRTAGCTIALDPTGNGDSDQTIVAVDFVENGGAKRTPIAQDPANGYSQAGQVITLHGIACAALQTAVVNDATARVEAHMGCACVPSAEICDDVIDNDCDGKVDEVCVPSNQCGVDAPEADCPVTDDCSQEVCDGKDNDCDGTVDDGCPDKEPVLVLR